MKRSSIYFAEWFGLCGFIGMVAGAFVRIIIIYFATFSAWLAGLSEDKWLPLVVEDTANVIGVVVGVAMFFGAMIWAIKKNS